MRLTPLFLVFVLAACGTDATATGSTCPSSSPPSYDSFGKRFFTTYCTGCHSAGAVNRHGAPRDQNFDTEPEIRAHADDIDREAAAGPDAHNTDMPDFSGPVRIEPTMMERTTLGQLLACEKRAR